MGAEEPVALTSLFKDVTPGDLDKFLATFTKYEKVFDKAVGVVEKLDKMGILPAAIRGLGEKAGVKDLDKPLKNPLNLVASSPAHYEFFRYLNKMQSDKIEEMHGALKNAIDRKAYEDAEAAAVIEVEQEEKKDEGTEEAEDVGV